jgi:hypothetical protein
VNQQIRKYPRTHHIFGSRLQPGDEDLQAVRFSHLRRKHLVVEEKVDGANAAISFDSAGKLQLQSRGHYLTGGPRERHFDLFKQWAHTVADELQPVLTDRYVMYGEWLYAKHTIFYDQLPSHFLEFDVLDLAEDKFLSTLRRRELLCDLPIASVPVLHMGTVASIEALTARIARSAFISTSHRQALQEICARKKLDPERIARETDVTPTMEGLYVKVEEVGAVVERYKYIRTSFLTTVTQSESHWLNRPIIPNQLRSNGGVDG